MKKRQPGKIVNREGQRRRKRKGECGNAGSCRRVEVMLLMPLMKESIH